MQARFHEWKCRFPGKNRQSEAYVAAARVDLDTAAVDQWSQPTGLKDPLRTTGLRGDGTTNTQAP
jgi:hypothetical protein